MKLTRALLAIASAVTAVDATGLAAGGCTYIPPPTPPPTPTTPTPTTPTPTTTAPPPPPVDCELYSALTDPSPWGLCKEKGNTNKYYSTKVLGIKTEPQNGGKPCPAETDPVRIAENLCKPIDCVPFTQAEDNLPWGNCTDDGTGKFFKTRVHDIKVPAENGGECDVEKRTDREPCAAVPCEVFTVDEDKGLYSPCAPDTTAVPIKYIQWKILGIKKPAENGGSCPSEAQRNTTLVCPPENCVPFSKAEDKGEYSKCFLQAGKYVKTKTLGVKTPEKNGGTCDPKDRLVEEPCAAIDCVLKTPAEDDGPFSNCTNFFNNGTYYQFKVLGIKVQPENGGAACPAETDLARTALVFCPPVNCVPLSLDEDKGEYSPCAKNETSGLYTQFKVLGIKTQAQNGGTCDPKDRTDIQICPPVNCVVKSEAEDDGPFGNCSNVFNNGTYYRSRVLGIKTEPLNGGLPCPAANNRTVYKFCPPENCVPLGNDTGTFGNCTDDDGDGKWYRSKVLGIKEPAQNGGTCDPKNRTVYEYCQPVNCTRFTEAEDKGPYGNCTLVGYGSYARNKTLGIKTPALYGGACPPVVVKKDCPNDGYCVPWDPKYDTCLTKLAQCGQKKRGWVYTDNLISVTQGLALWQCCDKCAATAGCAAYSYDTSRSKCSLTWEPNKWKFVDGAVTSSPVKPKPATCTYFDDRWLLTFFSTTLDEFRTDDLDECCRRCKVTYGCKGFYLSDSNCVLKTQEGVPAWWPDSRAGWARV